MIFIQFSQAVQLFASLISPMLVGQFQSGWTNKIRSQKTASFRNPLAICLLLAAWAGAPPQVRGCTSYKALQELLPNYQGTKEVSG